MGNSDSRNPLRHIECPVCKEYIKPPVYLCLDGHSFCENCRNKLDVCSLCKAKMTSTRNFTLEHLLENIKYSCENEGCQEMYLLKDVKNHCDNCRHASFDCPEITTCKWSGDLTKLIIHLKETHKIILNKSQHLCKYNDKISQTFYQLIGDYLFVTQVTYGKSNEIEANCQMYGPCNQIDKYCTNFTANGKLPNESIAINKSCEPYGSTKSFPMPLSLFKSIDAEEICFKVIKL